MGNVNKPLMDETIVKIITDFDTEYPRVGNFEAVLIHCAYLHRTIGEDIMYGIFKGHGPVSDETVWGTTVYSKIGNNVTMVPGFSMLEYSREDIDKYVTTFLETIPYEYLH